MGQLTGGIPPRQEESQELPSSKLVWMTFIWRNTGGRWEPFWHLGGSLMSLPSPLLPAPPCPQGATLSRKRNTSCGKRGSGRNKLCSSPCKAPVTTLGFTRRPRRPVRKTGLRRHACTRRHSREGPRTPARPLPSFTLSPGVSISLSLLAFPLSSLHPQGGNNLPSKCFPLEPLS